MTARPRTEEEPLLRPTSPSSPSVDTRESRSYWRRLLPLQNTNSTGLGREAKIVICVLCVQFLVSFAKHIIEVPTIRLFEIAICNRYYRSQQSIDQIAFSAANIDERRCKIPQIQNELAFLTGWRFAFDAVPSLLTALIYGRLADRIGRRAILSLACFGLLSSLVWVVVVCYANQVLPVKLVWASSVFIFVGGGQRVVKSIVFVILADILQQPQRTRYMYFLAAVPHLTTLIAPLFSNLFMNIDIWIPFAIAAGCLSTDFLVIWAMPESLENLHKIQVPAALADSTTPLLQTEQLPSTQQPPPAIVSPQHQSNEPTFWKQLTKLFTDVITLLKVPGLPFCLALFVLRPIAVISRAFVYQYASETFHWPMSRTNWLRFSQAVGSSLATFIFLPLLSTYLDRKDHNAKKLDLNVIRFSLLIAAIGFAILWQSKASWIMGFGLFICGLGEGFEPSLKGLATSLIDSSYNARLLTFAMVLEVVGKLIGGPLMARLFSIGRSDDHGSDGINFLTASVIFVFLVLAALTARLKR